MYLIFFNIFLILNDKILKNIYLFLLKYHKTYQNQIKCGIFLYFIFFLFAIFKNS